MLFIYWGYSRRVFLVSFVVDLYVLGALLISVSFLAIFFFRVFLVR